VPERLSWTVDLLDVRPTDHLLEIGCGPGHAVALVCDRLSRGTITAIDRSAAMIDRARARNRACIAAGRALIERRTLSDATFERRFGKIFAINVNAFWTAPAPTCAALRRLLRRDGIAFLTYEPPSAHRLRDLRRWLPRQLEEHGFAVIDIREQQFRKSSGLCVLTRVQ